MPEQISVQDLIRREAKAAGVPEALALAVAERESGFNPTAINPESVNGEQAVGTFQFLPSTARSRGIDPYDPAANIKGGVGYLRELLDRHQGDLPKVLAEYGGVRANTTYVPGVIEGVRRFMSQPAPSPAISRVGTPPTLLPMRFGEVPLPRIERPKGPVATPSLPTERPQGWLASAASEFNPLTRKGQRNLGGAVGAAGGAILAGPTAAVSGPVGPATGAVLGAMIAGGIIEGGHQLLGLAPKRLAAVGQAMTEQGSYEMGGRIVLAPLRLAPRWWAASRVRTEAAEALKTARERMMTEVEEAFDALKLLGRPTRGRATSAAAQGVREAVEAGSTIARAPGEIVGDLARQQTQAVRSQAAARVSGAAARAAGIEPSLTAIAPARVLQAPKAAAVGQAVEAVIEGPATVARRAAGEQVEQAAKSGPDIDTTALKEEAQSILEQIAEPQRAFPRQVVEEGGAALSAVLPGGTSEALARLEQQAAAGGKGAAEARAILAARETMLGDLEAAQKTVRRETLKHPAMDVINRILHAGAKVPFAAAHGFKRELDDALGTAWEASVRKRVTNITMKLRTTLRGELAGYAPYDTATAQYSLIVKKFTKGLVPRLRKAAVDNPESIVDLIKPGNPTRTRFVVDLLTKEAAEGGGAAEGQQALGMLQAAWTSKHLLSGGLVGLDKRLAALSPEFTQAFLGDRTGQEILTNLGTLAGVYRTLSKETVQAIKLARKPSEMELKFLGSTIHTRKLTAEQFGADLLRAGLLTPGVWGGLSLLRLLLGPSGKDIMSWAALSSPMTQLIARAATSPVPAMVAADVFRAAGLLGPEGLVPLGPGSQVATPPASAIAR